MNHVIIAVIGIALLLACAWAAGYVIAVTLGFLGIPGTLGVACWITAVIVGTLMRVFDPDTKRWVHANPAGTLAIEFGITAIAAFQHWIKTGSRFAGWVAILAGIVAIIFFVKHLCQRRNWCQQIGPWWRNTAVPKIKNAWTEVWTFFGKAGRWIRDNVVPGLYAIGRSMKPWFQKNFWLVASIACGIWACYIYKEPREWNQSKWFWIASALSTAFFLAWSETARGLVADFLRGCANIAKEKWVDLYKRFATKTSGGGKATVGAVAVVGLAVVSSLAQEMFHRGSGWAFQYLHINMWEFDRVGWSGVALVFAVFAVGIIALLALGPHLWPKKLKAAPHAAPAQPAPAANQVARAKAARRAARQAAADYLANNP